jgi:archaemetzincin
MAFRPPGNLERLKAIGPTGDLPETLRKAFDPGSDFEPMSPPRPGDWLASQAETGQTFEEFKKERWNRPGGARNRIFIQPIGAFERDASPPLATLEAYAKAFFSMDVSTLQPLDARGLTSRRNPYTGNVQILSHDILGLLLEKLPGDAYCILGITMQDLYPDPSWNFVFGQASLRDRVGVYSFARYDPAFHGEARQEGYQKFLLKRSLKVLSHETAHMFGLQHCIFYRCVMNGSNHLEESDSRPLHLCPVCLRKLHDRVGFEVIGRYRALLRFYSEAGLAEEAQWVSKRLDRLTEGSPPRITR